MLDQYNKTWTVILTKLFALVEKMHWLQYSIMSLYHVQQHTWASNNTDFFCASVACNKSCKYVKLIDYMIITQRKTMI